MCYKNIYLIVFYLLHLYEPSEIILHAVIVLKWILSKILN